MNRGSTLPVLATELDRQRRSRKDYLAPAGRLRFAPAAIAADAVIDHRPDVVLEGLNGSSYGVTDNAHRQFGDFLGIPARYYDRMRQEAPDLLAANLNEWLRRAGNERRLVRTLDGKARAILSDRYRPLDNYDLLEAALPGIQQAGAEVVSSSLTESRMYVKAICRSLAKEVKTSLRKGDVIEAGIVVSNSEVGAGSVRVEPYLRAVVCDNGMIANDSRIRQFHVGKGDDGDGVREFIKDETRAAKDRAFWMTVRDVVAGAFDVEILNRLVERAERATQEAITNSNFGEVVEMTTERLGLPEGSREGILKALIEGRDFSRWGLVNAITAQGNEEKDYELATQYERAGGVVLELPQTDWAAITSRN